MPNKHIFQSKTFWFNVLIMLLPLLSDHIELLRSYLSDGGFLVVMMLVGAGNVYLRSVTSQPVRMGK
ncbi:hypothetical protein [Methylobacter sp.]|uniref:hypothetical protein n=1 Tax=Methylobacter sp. TaxID=2051955 RepID=UPI00248847A5|nr:hypothetical protein [Methylobacter sp.]MDI1278037.1 hypothetical protein [Methylobacter sp.]